MTTGSHIVLVAALRIMRPLVRMLLRHGVTYPAFVAALKQVFLDAARDELDATGKKQTDSALSLLSGVHRRDVRTMMRSAAAPAEPPAALGLASEVVGRWLSEVEYLDDEGQPRPLPRAADGPSFDALVASISSDVRPRAVLDELLRLGSVEEADGEVRLLAAGFAPREGLAEMATLLQQNLHDHTAAAVSNLGGGGNYLEQSLFVDELGAESVRQLHLASAAAWRVAMKNLMREARARYEADRANTAPQLRVYRIRFGSYFYAADENDRPA